MNVKIWLISAALFSLTSVAMGAFAAHGLKAILSEYELSIIETGARYQMYHALAIFMVSLLALYLKPYNMDLRFLKASNLMFMLGIVLFSGSLYALAMLGTKWLVFLTPLGGVAFIIAWSTFIIFCLKSNLNQTGNN